MADSTGMIDIRAENVDRAVKGFALQKYKIKGVCLVQSSSAWKETYYKESSAELSGQGLRSYIMGRCKDRCYRCNCQNIIKSWQSYC